MSDIMKHGGPAHPVAVGGGEQYFGMTLRDWFAGQVLLGMLASRVNYPVKGDGWNNMADEAYEAADAMLKERNTERSR